VSPTSTLRLAGYVRVSRVGGREGESFQSPEQQRDTITAYARAHGHEVVDFTEDLDVSGGKLTRPGLDAVLARIRAGEVQGLVVSKLDRLSRAGVADALKLVESIHEAGGQVVAVDLGLDPSTPFGEFGLTIMLALARMERRRLSDSWEEAKARALDRGAKIGPTPFGYVRREDGGLEPHSERADYVREAYRLARGGVPEVVAYLDGLGLVHEDGKRVGRPLSWTAYTVRRLLANRTYLGEQNYAAKTYAGQHEALVTRAEFELAQHEPVGHRAPPADFPLSGLASCATCGGPMVGGRGGKNARTYRCAASLAHARRRGTSCPAPATMVADRLEERLDAVLRSWAETHGALVLAEEGSSAAVEVALSEAEAADAEVAAFVEFTPARTPGYADGLARRQDAAAAAWDAYREAGAGVESHDRIVSGLQRLDGATREEWGQLVREVVEVVEVKRGRGPVEGRVRVLLQDAGAPDLPERPEDAGTVVGELPEPTESDAPAHVWD
jgi:site-specific DNA recombinase